MYLIRAFCHPANEDDALCMLTRLLGTRERQTWKASYLHQALMHLADEDAKEFKDLQDAEEDSLRANIIVKRTGVSHEKSAALTPDCIKNLRPLITEEMKKETPYSSVLVWQASENCFQGYYPRTRASMAARNKSKRFLTASKTYNASVSQTTALLHVVKCLWLDPQK